jgi:UDP-3-O-[3-hydroxymyristoyl] N-acetylglucosamine deacetylase
MNTCIDNQRTLKNVIRATGFGLHGGAPVRATLRPAPPDHGIVFVRTDLDFPVRFPARVERAGFTSLATTLLCGDIRLAAVEHLLAAFAGLRVDNALVEVDGAELPHMDGSAGPFVFLIQAAGIAVQDAPRRYLRVRKPVRVSDGEAWAELRPHDGLRLEYTVEYDHPAGDPQRRSAVIELSQTAFVREIARARTLGLPTPSADCGSPEYGRAATVVPARSGDRLDPRALRLGDEFVRHKILDALGDLCLLGCALQGAFTGFRSGHGTNRALLGALLDDAEAWELVTRADPVPAPDEFDLRFAETA